MFDTLIFPKPPVSFSFLVLPTDLDVCNNWLHRYMAYPMQFRDWLRLWQGFTKPLFPATTFSFTFTPAPYIPGTVPDPFIHRKEAGEIFEHYFFKSQWIRSRIRALIRFRRIRIMNQRLIGEVDVGTLELIPPHHQVRVYDWNTKSVYQFHTHTIHKQCISALRYQSYAISLPKLPRNPYTNVVWSVAQLSVLIDQIHRNLWNARQRMMDSSLQTFRIAGLNLETFKKRVGKQLDIECAHSFFRDCHGVEWLTVYSETVDDLEEFANVYIPPNMRTKLLDRTFPPTLLREWDDVLLGIWGYNNLDRIIIQAGSIYEVIEMAKQVLERTNLYLTTKK